MNMAILLLQDFCNVKVLKFSVGFGKPIFSRISKKSNTEYSLCMIPLGGYVQMLESKNAEGISNNLGDSDYEYCFDKKNVYQRFAIVSAGPNLQPLFLLLFFHNDLLKWYRWQSSLKFN